MMYDKQDLFPVPLFRLEYMYAEELKNIACDLFYEIEKQDTTPVNYSENGYTNYGKGNILDLEQFKQFKKYIIAAVRKIHADTGIAGDITLTNSWFSINRKYSYHERHNHLPEIWSGVYYVKADVDDAPLSFINKNLESHWPFVNLLYNNEYNSAVTSCSVKTGTLYIFPSFLEHAVNQQINDNDRITIAFNFGIKKENT